MKSATIILCAILLMPSCQSSNSAQTPVQTLTEQAPWFEQSFIFESGFKGPFHLMEDESLGVYRSVREGVVIEEVPQSGILLVKKWGTITDYRRAQGKYDFESLLNEGYAKRDELMAKHPELMCSHYRDGTVLPHWPEGKPGVVGVWILGGFLPNEVMEKYGKGYFIGGETGFVGTEAELHQYIREHCPDMKHRLPENRTKTP